MDTRQIESELVVKAVRSGGPGGQNVNKVSTKIQLYFNVAQSQGLTDEERLRITQKLSSRISADGILMVHSDLTRSQLKNRGEAMSRLFELLEQALIVEKPRKVRRIPKAAVEKRLKAKKVQSEVKQARRKPNF
ncbi:MAG TPA: alternative ribosome rescue aminoacyl-tRNA hydrolase ArfB [Flavobacterium sp.]|nr:alternative ribosome rescue aminoacyl-tRNA hydrolase ArfB [Flavobacterium sp.]